MASAGGSLEAGDVSVRTSIVPPGPCPPSADTPDTSPAAMKQQLTASFHDFAVSLPAGGAQTAQKQHAGLLKLDAQPSAARIRPPEGAARKVSASVRRASIPDTYAASGPEPGTWKDPDPRRRSSRGSGGSE